MNWHLWLNWPDVQMGVFKNHAFIGGRVNDSLRMYNLWPIFLESPNGLGYDVVLRE